MARAPYAGRRSAITGAKIALARCGLSMSRNQKLCFLMASTSGRPWNGFMFALEMDGSFLERPHSSKYGHDCHVGAGRPALRRFLEY